MHTDQSNLTRHRSPVKHVHRQFLRCHGDRQQKVLLIGNRVQVLAGIYLVNHMNFCFVLVLSVK